MGEEVLAADFNSMVQRQVVATFANAAARDAAIPAPAPGMMCCLIDTGTLQQYTDKAPTPSWQKPWGQPWGRVLHVLTGDVTTQGALIIPNSGFAFPLANRRYQITWSGNVIKANDNVGTITINIDRGDAFLYTVALFSLNPNFRTRGVVSELVTATPQNAGGVVIVSCDVGQVSLNYGRLSLDDVGPA